MSSAILEFKHLSRHFVLRVLVLVHWYKQNVFNGDLVQRAGATRRGPHNAIYRLEHSVQNRPGKKSNCTCGSEFMLIYHDRYSSHWYHVGQMKSHRLFRCISRSHSRVSTFFQTFSPLPVDQEKVDATPKSIAYPRNSGCSYVSVCPCREFGECAPCRWLTAWRGVWVFTQFNSRSLRYQNTIM